MRRSGGVVRLLVGSDSDEAWYTMRRSLPPGWLAVVANGSTTVVVLAADVPGPAVAAALWHLRARHVGACVTACKTPYCDAVEAWRPAARAPMTDAVTA